MEPYGVTLFCEDIRYEGSTQLTLVGVFTGDIMLHQVPVTIPKLGVVTRFNLPWDCTANKVVWKIFFPGDPADTPGFQVEMDIRELLTGNRKHIPTTAIDDDINLSHNFQQQIVLSPVQIKQSGFIKVRISVDDQLVKAGAIRVAVTSLDMST